MSLAKPLDEKMSSSQVTVFSDLIGSEEPLQDEPVSEEPLQDEPGSEEPLQDEPSEQNSRCIYYE